jgi:hypothetical protein
MLVLAFRVAETHDKVALTSYKCCLCSVLADVLAVQIDRLIFSPVFHCPNVQILQVRETHELKKKEMLRAWQG